MWSPEFSQLDSQNNGTVFLLAAWHELFDAFTPDSFQPRLHHLPSLIDELEVFSARINDSSLWWKHVHNIRDEIRAVSVEQQYILDRLPEYQWLVRQLLTAERASEIHDSAVLLQQRKQELQSEVLKCIRLCAAGLPKGKKAAHRELRNLATLAIQSGKEDDDVLQFSHDLTRSPDDVMEDLVSMTLREQRKYEVVFGIAGSQRNVQRIVRRSGFQLVTSSTLPQDEVTQLECAHQELHFSAGAIDASSTRNAVSEARQKIGTAIDIFNLYENSLALRIVDVAFVRPEGASEYRAFDQAEQAFRRLRPRSKSARDTLETLDMVANNRLEDRVLNALELHSLAMASTEPRIKLVSLWSALECLAGCCDSKSIIDRVTELVTPLLVWRRVDKVVRYAAIATKQFADVRGELQLGEGFTRSDARFVHPWDMMMTLTRPDQHDHILSLLKFTGPHPYLVFRLHGFWEQLHDPACLHRVLLKSRERIQWQIYRIYRARNLLVHDGIETVMLGPLLDNLHYYASVVISRLIHGLKFDPSWGVRESLNYWNQKCHYMLDTLESNPSSLRTSDFFPMAASADAPKPWGTN